MRREISQLPHAGIAVGAALALTAAAVPGATAQVAVAVTVDTASAVVDFGGEQMVADLPGPDGQTSLREAAIASTNTEGPETIAFDIPTSDPGFTGREFVLSFDPPSRDDAISLGDDRTTLDATTQPGGFPIALEGGGDDIGLRLTSADNSVVGLTVRQYGAGMLVDGDSNTITGSTFTADGVGLLADGRGHVIRDNTSTGNSSSGFSIDAVGGVVADNTASGNGATGMTIDGTATVTGNVITDNVQMGIWVFDGSGTIAGNTITGNGEEGIRPGSFAGTFETHYTISRNSISDNAGLGIDLEGLGVTKNDGQDKDDGANDLLNFPDLKAATDTGAGTVVEGHLKAPSPSFATIEFFASAAPDPSGFGEGETFLGTAEPDTKGRFTATLPAGLAGQWITATATDGAGNTSEFSAAVMVDVPKT